MDNISIILASASPRRSEIMNQVNLRFEVIPSDCNEVITSNIPEKIVEELCYQKAKDVFDKVDKEKVIVIGADTVVAHNGKVLGKPKSKDEAYAMIDNIQGDIHSVYTGVSMITKVRGDVKDKIDKKILELSKENQKYDDIYVGVKKGDTIIKVTFHVKTDVCVRKMTNKQISDYVSTKEPYDKAGGYGIQGLFAININSINGDYYNVVGLPISKLNEKLECFYELLR